MSKYILRYFLIVFLLNVACSKSQMPQFDQNNAFACLEAQCAFGYRHPGSEGHEKCLDYLVDELRKNADQVVKQPFHFVDPRTNSSYQLNNVIASFGSQGERILLCAHWDSRPVADFDPEPANRQKPVLGANDGASGVAVLLEIARLLKLHPPKMGVDIVLFDGEDSGMEGNPNSWCHGSRFFAQNKQSTYRPQFAILLDMIGDKDLELPIEVNSINFAPDLVDRVWTLAENLGLSAFRREQRHQMVDDHLELLNVGIPAIDIIDFDYPYWHTVEDTEDKCSPESLGVVGTLLVHLLYE